MIKNFFRQLFCLHYEELICKGAHPYLIKYISTWRCLKCGRIKEYDYSYVPLNYIER
jgi:hypothetical protein